MNEKQYGGGGEGKLQQVMKERRNENDELRCEAENNKEK